MRGHLQIIAVRQQGKKPRAVFLAAGLTPPRVRYRFEDPEKQIEIGALPTVHIASDELKGPLDLRFLAGCRVHVQGRELSDDILNLADRVIAASAKHVIVCGLESAEIMEYKNNEWRVL